MTTETELEDEYRPCECSCWCTKPRDERVDKCWDCRDGLHLDRQGLEIREDGAYS